MIDFRNTIGVLVLACVAAAWPSFAFAQSRSFEVFGGYSYLNDPSHSVLTATSGDNAFPAGWAAGCALRAWRSVALVADASGHYKRTTTLADDVRLSYHTVAAGPRVAARIGPFVEFAEVIVGVAVGRGSAFGVNVSETALLLQGGGGVDLPATGRLAARIELDYRRIPGSAQGRLPSNQFRAVAAVVVR